jgi:menaquinone-dependent protoporphyrinogen oxidase
MDTMALVAYATKHGSTADIAERIGETLRDRGIPTDVAPARSIRSIDEYGLVVVGSAVYLTRWQGEAVDFLQRFGHGLRERPLWLFGSGPTGGTPDADAKLEEVLRAQPPAPGNIHGLAERLGARPYRTFGGRAGPEMGGVFERWIPKGDWRDLDAIRDFAMEIADSVQPVGARPLG